MNLFHITVKLYFLKMFCFFFTVFSFEEKKIRGPGLRSFLLKTDGSIDFQLL